MTKDQKIETYIEVLKEYNEHTNVYSKKSYDKLEFHCNDCRTLAGLVGDKALDVLDMGSGSGFPSIILAIMNENSHVTAVESKRKKCVFLEEVRDRLELHNFEVANMDINEYIHKAAPEPDVVTAKAFAPYNTVLKLAKKMSRRGVRLYVPISEVQYQTLSLVPNPPFKLIREDGFLYLHKRY